MLAILNLPEQAPHTKTHQYYQLKFEKKGENDFVASTTRFVHIASANQNCYMVTVSLITPTTVIVLVTIHNVVVTLEIVTKTIGFAEAI